MKVFISQPMRDRTKEEILKEREEIITKIKEQYSYFTIFGLKCKAFLSKYYKKRRKRSYISIPDMYSRF